MTQEKLQILKEELGGLHSAADHLAYSLERSRDLVGRDEWSLEDLERLESLTSRFARLSDLLIQRIFRLVDEIELAGGGTLLDRIFRAEKQRWGDANVVELSPSPSGRDQSVSPAPNGPQEPVASVGAGFSPRSGPFAG